MPHDDLTPDDLARLLLPATPALLEGWCGPVVTQKDGPAMVYNGVLHGLHGLHGSTVGGYFQDCAALHLCLDLARAECADRVARVLASAINVQGPSYRDGLNWGAVTVQSDTWSLFAGGKAALFRARRDGRYSDPPIVVPALATLDPTDPRRLPDGSRYVDRLALRLVAGEVLHDNR